MDQTEKKHTTTSSTLAGLSLSAVRNPFRWERKMMCVMTKAKMKMVRKESERMNM